MKIEKITWTDYIKTVPAKHREGLTIVGEDLTNVEFTVDTDITGYSFESCDLSKVSGMTSEHLRQIEYAVDTKLPEKVEGLELSTVKEQWRYFEDCTWPEVALAPGEDFSGMDLSGSDISLFKNVTVSALAVAKGLVECKTPPIAVAATDDFSRLNLTDLDISHWVGVTAKHVNAAPEVAGCKLPKMDLHELDMSKKSFSGVDMSSGYGLSWKQCKLCKDISDAKLPYMVIPMDKDKYIEDTPETRKAIDEKRQPKKTVDVYFDLGEISILGTDFSKIKNLNQEQVDAINARGGKNATVGETISQSGEFAERQKRIHSKAMEMAEIIAPMSKDSQKQRYRCPQWLSGPVQTLAWFCDEEKLHHKEVALKFVGIAPENISEAIAEYKKEIKWAKQQEKECEKSSNIIER